MFALVCCSLKKQENPRNGESIHSPDPTRGAFETNFLGRYCERESDCASETNSSSIIVRDMVKAYGRVNA